MNTVKFKMNNPCNMQLDSLGVHLTSYLNKNVDIIEKLDFLDSVVAHIFEYSVNDCDANIYPLLMPILENIVTESIHQNVNYTSSSSGNSSNSLFEELRKNLNVVIRILHLLTKILTDIVNYKANHLVHCQSIEKYSATILINVFQHCKNSTLIYAKYIAIESEILQLFKEAYKVHSKLLELFNIEFCPHNIVPNYLGTTLMLQGLDVLKDMAEVLSYLNIKSMCYTLKTYVSIIKRNPDLPRNSANNTTSALKLLSDSLIKYLDMMANFEPANIVQIRNNLKVVRFLLKLSLELCSSCLDVLTLDSILLLTRLLGSLHKVDPVYLTYKMYPMEIVEWVNINLICSYDELLTKLLQKKNFCEIFFGKDNCFAEEEVHFIFFANNILKKIYHYSTAHPSDSIDLSTLLIKIFSSIDKGYIPLFWNTPEAAASFYGELLVNIVLGIISEPLYYCAVETVLMSNILSENELSAILAADIWCLCLSQMDPHTCYIDICHIINESSVLLNADFTSRPELVHLKSFIKRAYQILDDSYKIAFSQKYPLDDYTYIWNIIGLNPVKYNTNLNALALAVCEPTRSTMDFLLKCKILDGLATVNYETHDSSRQYAMISDRFMQLWEFDLHNTSLLTSNLFKIFILKLFKCTKKFLPYFKQEHLLLIFLQLKKLIPISLCLKILAVHCITEHVTHIATRQETLHIAADILKTILQDSNPVIQACAMESFSPYNLSAGKEDLIDIVCSYKECKELLSNFFQFDTETAELTNYVEVLKESQFEHHCLEWSSLNVTSSKKIKTQRDVDVIIDNVIEQVVALKQVSQTVTLSEKNVADIQSVIHKLQTII